MNYNDFSQDIPQDLEEAIRLTNMLAHEIEEEPDQFPFDYRLNYDWNKPKDKRAKWNEKNPATLLNEAIDCHRQSQNQILQNNIELPVKRIINAKNIIMRLMVFLKTKWK